MEKPICFIACLFIAAFAQQENTFLDKTNLGIKLGINLPDMAYSNKKIDGFKSSAYANGLFELFGEYDIAHSFSARPGLKYTTRGQHIDENLFSYEYNAKYIELALPAIYTFPAIKIKSSDIFAYLLVGPVIGFPIGGDIKYSEDGGTQYETEINKSNTSPYAFGLHIGTGLKYPISIKEFPIVLGLEAGYHIGLTDTYSDEELAEKSNALNADDYKIDWTRKHRGIELGITIAVPLSNFKKPKPPEPMPEPAQETMPEQQTTELLEANQ